MSNPTAVLIGYSGHGLMCLEVATLNDYTISGYCDQNLKEFNPLNLKFLGSETQLEAGTNAILGIGDNDIRFKIYKELPALNYINIIHPSAIVAWSVKLNEGVVVAANAVLNPFAKIGTGVIINTSAIVEHECVIGDFSHIAPAAVLCGNVKVGKRSFIGANSVIKQGVTIGDDVIVGAGSVVISDIPNNTTVVGNPGRILKK